MSNSTRLRYLLCCTVLGVAACSGTATSPIASPVVTTPTGKSAVSAAVAGKDLIELANVVNLATDVYSASSGPAASAPVVTTLNQVAAGFSAAGTSLASSKAVSGDLAANIGEAEATLMSAFAGAVAAQPSLAPKINSLLAGVKVAVDAYNTDAVIAGLPALPALPASV
jgi:hypothetical protein